MTGEQSIEYCRVPGTELRAARANRVFRADEKRIRTENAVMGKNKGGLGWFLYKIVDCARICFSSVRNPRSARTVFCPRKKWPAHNMTEKVDCVVIGAGMVGLDRFYEQGRGEN